MGVQVDVVVVQWSELVNGKVEEPSIEEVQQVESVEEHFGQNKNSRPVVKLSSSKVYGKLEMWWLPSNGVEEVHDVEVVSLM